MNRLTRFFLVFLFFMSALGLTPAGSTTAASLPVPGLQPPGPGGPPDESPEAPDLSAATHWSYLPLMIRSSPAFIVRGRVLDESGLPVSGATITSDTGSGALTNAAGEYAIGANAGLISLAASKAGFMFSPAMLEVYVTNHVSGQDFTALTAGLELISNNSFESNAWWTLVSGGYPPGYSTWTAHSGSRSLRLGITNAWENQLADSRLRTPTLTIPTNAAGAALRLWLFPITGETPTAAPQADPAVESAEMDAPAFGDATLLYDAQYVRVLDANNAVIGTLLYIRSNNQFWTYHQFDLLPFAGRTIKLEFGAYNDGTDGVTALYVDDVSLQVTYSGAQPPPPPPLGVCANQVANGNFEYNGSWNLPATPYPAGYSYDYAYSGVRSMRTGIPLYTASNIYSYSDAWQNVYIPTGASNVKLKLRLLPLSQEIGASAAPEPDEVGAQLAPGVPAEGLTWDEQALAPESPDAQYVLLLNTAGVILRTLEWWTPRNASGWLYREYDLSAYAGQYVRIQVGTFNDGVGGRSVMYVDAMAVEVCNTPTPPPVCSERVTNGGFESNSAWYIPNTAFSAGYSTWLRRTGARSMRTGIVYSYHNRYSYSDFRQAITIPAGTGSATLRFHAFSMSGEAIADVPLDPEPLRQGLEAPTAFTQGAEAMAGDVQYLLVLDRYGNWIDTLLWRRSNESYWRSFAFNLNRYIGQTILLQWGTFNNGYGGVTSMYIDDVTLQACP